MISQIMDSRKDSWLKFGTEEFSVVALLGLLYVFLVYLIPMLTAPVRV